MDPNTNQNLQPQTSNEATPPQQQQTGTSPIQGSANTQIPNNQVPTSVPSQEITSTPFEDNAKSGTKTIVLIFIMLIIIGLLATFIVVFGRNLWK